MAKFKRHLPMSVTIAIIIHVVAAILLVAGYQLKHEKVPFAQPAINTVKAKIINTEELAAEKKRKEALQRKALEQQRLLAEQEKLRQEKIKQAAEKKRQAALAEEKKKAQEAERRAELERKKVQEAKRIAEQKKAKEIKKLAEKKKLAAEKKRKEQKKLAAERAAEKKRLAKILEQEEAEIKAAELKTQRAVQAREMNRLITQYQDAIRNKIQRRWRKPLNEQPDAWCRVYVRQAPGGYVEKVEVEECTGDEAFRRSVEEAVWKSDPLPQPPSPELFDRDLRFKFIPEI